MSSMSISTLTSFKPHSRLPPLKICPSIRPKSLNLEHRHRLSVSHGKKLGLQLGKNFEFSLKVKNKDEQEERESGSVDEDEESLRGQGTMPDRFRPFLKDLPEPPVRWPYFVALPFFIYAWRSVFSEFSNWTKAFSVILSSFLNFFLDIFKFILAIILMVVGNPITTLIRAIETVFYTVRSSYSSIIAYTPISELTTIIILSSATLAIAEATEPTSVNHQQYLLTIAGLVGFAAVKSFISEPLFYMILLGLFGFARFVKKRDYVSSLLPVAAVLVAVGHPWFRVLVMAAYLGLAIVEHSRRGLEDKEGGYSETEIRVPVPLTCAALAVGVRLAANWLGYRHLTWMIV